MNSFLKQIKSSRKCYMKAPAQSLPGNFQKCLKSSFYKAHLDRILLKKVLGDFWEYISPMRKFFIRNAKSAAQRSS